LVKAETFLSDAIWVLSDGRPGHLSQTLGLAEALTPRPVVKIIRLRSPYRQASPFLGWGGGNGLAADSARIEPPWPGLVITSGRSAIPIALGIKRATRGRTKVVNVQDPGYFRGCFDLIFVPDHDGMTGPNIVSTLGALGRITSTRLATARAAFEPSLSHLPRPRVAVLIGGANASFQTPAVVSERIGEALATLARDGAGLMVTFSRRSGPEMERIIRGALAGCSAVIWDGTGDNPYFAYLAFADHILATEDSASMVSEAATTGKPISILALEGGSPKFSRFHAAMAARGVSRPFAGIIDEWSYAPFDETERAATAVRMLMEGKGAGTL